MIGFRPQKPTWRSPHEIVRRTSPRAIAAAGPPVSAGWDELSDLALMLAAGVRALLRDRQRERRREEDAARVEKRLPAEPAPLRIGAPQRQQEQSGELRPRGERDEDPSRRRGGHEHEAPDQ